jgi:hypothetical protein
MVQVMVTAIAMATVMVRMMVTAVAGVRVTAAGTTTTVTPRGALVAPNGEYEKVNNHNCDADDDEDTD